MSTTLGRRLAIVWGFLSAITLCQGLLLTPGDRAFALDAMLTAGVVLVSLVKVRLILREFMELRCAPPLLRHLADAWLLVTAVCLLAPYFAMAA